MAKRKTKEQKDLEQVARETLVPNSKWGSGRERDIMLRDAGFDPEEVQQERARLRVSE